MNVETKEPKPSTCNGVDADALRETIAYLGENPDLANFAFRARNEWIDGSRNEASINTFHALGEEHERRQTHLMKADQPALILGQDTAPNPVENLLAALSSCIATTAVYHAAASGEKIEELTSELEGAIDVKGFMGIDPDVREGFNRISVKVKAKTSADEKRLMDLISKSPVLDVLRNGTQVDIDIETKA
ncbi:OsmC family protein [Puniceicoccaceae bacterium K14]|nr:OsmC family protein [Puniceicoccaceae bacterium K14]